MLQDFFVHPDRQVYFFASFSQNEVEEFHKYIVIDAETKRELQEGKSYHHCDNPIKNKPPIGGLFFTPVHSLISLSFCE